MPRDSVNQELRNLWWGDYLTCQACGAWIFQMPNSAQIVYYRNIGKAYDKHLQECASKKKDVHCADDA